MGKKGGGGSTTTTYKPSPEERALINEQLKYIRAVQPTALKLNETAGNLLFDSLGDTKVDYGNMMKQAVDLVNRGTSGIQDLTQGKLPAGYQQAMENSIKSGVSNTMGNLLAEMGNRGIVNSSVMNTGLKGISDSVSEAMAQNFNNNISQLSTLNGQLIDAAGQPIATAAAAQEAAQSPALNAWNASLGLNSAGTSALSAIGGKGTTTQSQRSSGGGGLFGGILTGLASNAALFCFAPETVITMADGTEKPIKEVKAGEKVLCPNGDGTESEESVLQVLKPHYNDCWNIITNDGKENYVVSATLTQPIMAEDGTFIEIGKLTLGTPLKGKGKVINMVHSGERKVYDLQVSGNNNYYADGFIAKGGGTENWVKG